CQFERKLPESKGKADKRKGWASYVFGLKAQGRYNGASSSVSYRNRKVKRIKEKGGRVTFLA
ncbi:hypothetical protein VS883_29100, partial [Escherichia coli]